MTVSPEKQRTLEARFKQLGIVDSDVEEQFIRSQGKGGQHVNKASTAVSLIHRPTGIRVKCQISRSQADNRFFARRILADKIEAQIKGALSAEQHDREKIRRQKRKRSARAKKKMLENKRKQSTKKGLRAKVNIWESG